MKKFLSIFLLLFSVSAMYSQEVTELPDNDVTRAFVQGMELMDSNKYSESMVKFRYAAEKGFMVAQYYLGELLCGGIGNLPVDMKEAFKWMKIVAETDEKVALKQCGDVGYIGSALNFVGNCYHSGTGGVSQDYNKAVECYRKAASKYGTPGACYNLGYCYDSGSGVPVNYKNAVYWYQKAAEKGYELSYYNLAIHYGKGEGVEKDDEKAFYWCRKAAETGDCRAQYTTGLIYLEVKGDKEEALKWLRMSAQQGYTKAQIYLNKIEYNKE